MIEEAAQIPGVTAVGTIDEPPLNAGGSSTPVYREGTEDFRGSNSALTAKFYTISPGYLRAAGTRLVAGRDFTWHDDRNARCVALVNEDFRAHALWQCAGGDWPAICGTWRPHARHSTRWSESSKTANTTRSPKRSRRRCSGRWRRTTRTT